MSRKLEEIARDIRPIVAAAVKDLGPDLQGSSIVDLVLDNLDDRISVSDVKSALVIADVDAIVTYRVRQIYSKWEVR